MYVRQRANLRPHSTDMAHDLINRRTCLHVDAWLYQDENDAMYVHIIYSAAGKQHVATETYALVLDQRWELRRVHTFTTARAQSMMKRYINSAWGKRKHPYLADVHTRLIMPLIWRSDLGTVFKGYRSVALHYIWTNPKVNLPEAGMTNHYGATGYHARYPDSGARELMSEVDLQREYEKATRLPPKERSIMRTLDKVLRNQNST